LAAHVNHAVDAAGPAQSLAARIAQAAAVQAGVGFRVVEPIGARIADAVEVTDRDVDPVVVVTPPRFQQQHPLRRVGGEPICQQAAGGAGPNDDVVEVSVAHLPSLLGCWHYELRTFPYAFRPALHDGFLLGVEAHALFAIG